MTAFRGGADRIEAGAGQDRVDAGAGNDTVLGGSEGDILMGGDDADKLYADAERTLADATLIGATQVASHQTGDWLDGGAGDDLLVGEAGKDTYRLSFGDSDNAGTLKLLVDSQGSNTLAFGAGIDPNTVTAQWNGDDLILAYSAGDAIYIQAARSAIGQITFADSTSLTLDQLLVKTVAAPQTLIVTTDDGCLAGEREGGTEWVVSDAAANDAERRAVA